MTVLSDAVSGRRAPPDPRSIYVHNLYQKAAQQFDYLVTGATGAVCTYILQTLQPRRIDLSLATAELLALLILIVSVILGFKLIESKVTTLRLNQEWLAHSERLGALLAALPQFPGVSQETGEIVTPAGAAQEVPVLQEKVLLIKEVLDHRSAVCGRLYVWRNRCLAGGFLLLVLARLAGPYMRS